MTTSHDHPLKTFSNRTFLDVTRDVCYLSRTHVDAVRFLTHRFKECLRSASWSGVYHTSSPQSCNISPLFKQKKVVFFTKGKHTFQPLWTFLNNVCQSVHLKTLSGERQNRGVKIKVEFCFSFHPKNPNPVFPPRSNHFFWTDFNPPALYSGNHFGLLKMPAIIKIHTLQFSLRHTLFCTALQLKS